MIEGIDNMIETVEEIEEIIYGRNGCNYHVEHFTKGFFFTDGIEELAGKTGCFWLIDLIASYQKQINRRENPLQDFQVWELFVGSDTFLSPDTRGNQKAIIFCRTDSKTPVQIKQEIEYTDFPLDYLKLWVCNEVLMLPSEY